VEVLLLAGSKEACQELIATGANIEAADTEGLTRTYSVTPNTVIMTHKVTNCMCTKKT